ncbi:MULTISPECIES: hypothetical protein [Cyanophyceae]|uniref:hypothetical protein n=1 Tax=Cyanophyceae TaxID=3028117 RepID=UPI000301EE18|nr:MULTISPECIES: hypothetical protein [Cyanophyceae]ANV91247.1 hypothetical protein AWQ24_11750 [Picosynechococcus sp. PCC 8807]QCS50774.1 hypothetical protein FEK30_15835 [Picosynechococcus sp. PCC 11901]SMH52571.1 hypothetical protein SAMN06272755_2494 [Picosynechococcus sp. OG1]SMQ82349.1 hypothetical protein SAMN06272774_1768 [Synechococcus sp. 7002]
MKKTLYIPDELWQQLDQYLQTHPEENASSLVQSALRDKLRPRNGQDLLDLAGLVRNAPVDASTNPLER